MMGAAVAPDSPQKWSHLRPPCPAGRPVHTGPWRLGAPPPAASGWSLHRWWWSRPVIKNTLFKMSDHLKQSIKYIFRILNVTPMSSTNILSRPTGPSELLTMFAMEDAAMTGTKTRMLIVALQFLNTQTSLSVARLTSCKTAAAEMSVNLLSGAHRQAPHLQTMTVF